MTNLNKSSSIGHQGQRGTCEMLQSFQKYFLNLSMFTFKMTFLPLIHTSSRSPAVVVANFRSMDGHAPPLPRALLHCSSDQQPQGPSGREMLRLLHLGKEGIPFHSTVTAPKTPAAEMKPCVITLIQYLFSVSLKYVTKDQFSFNFQSIMI